MAFVAADVRHVVSQEQLLKILRQAHDVSPDGSYSYSYETENGISADETGEPRIAGEDGPAIAVQGSYRYVGTDGVTYEVQYTADENGFHPVGAHLPIIPDSNTITDRTVQVARAQPRIIGKEVNIKPRPFRF